MISVTLVATWPPHASARPADASWGLSTASLRGGGARRLRDQVRAAVPCFVCVSSAFVSCAPGIRLVGRTASVWSDARHPSYRTHGSILATCPSDNCMTLCRVRRERDPVKRVSDSGETLKLNLKVLLFSLCFHAYDLCGTLAKGHACTARVHLALWRSATHPSNAHDSSLPLYRSTSRSNRSRAAANSAPSARSTKPRS